MFSNSGRRLPPKASHSSGFFDSSFVYFLVSPLTLHPNVRWGVRLGKSLIMHCLLGSGTVPSPLLMNTLNLCSSLRFRRQNGRNETTSYFGGLHMTCRTGFGLQNWIFCTLSIHTTRNYRQLKRCELHTSQFTVTHALGFSVFTSHILATDL
jgi:hypothetical protein